MPAATGKTKDAETTTRAAAPAHRPPERAPETDSGAQAGVPVFLLRGPAAAVPSSADAGSADASGDGPLAALTPDAPGIAGAILRTKLVVGGVDDPAEHQAEAVAESVVRAPSPDASAANASASAAPASFGSASAAPSVAATPAGASSASATVRRAPVDGGAAPASAPATSVAAPASPVAPAVHSAPAAPVGSSPVTAAEAPAAKASDPIPGHGPGTPMSPRTRDKLESHLGVDLGAVRVHKGPDAHDAASALGARAFAAGSNIWLGKGESDEDAGLMAHETAHVLQQEGVVRRAPASAPPAAPAPKKPPRPPASGASISGSGGASSGSGGSPAASGAGGAGQGATVAPPPAGPAPASVDVPMQMPEPPSEMSADTRQRLEHVESSNASVAEAAADLPPADEQTADARGAVAEPTAETQARSQEGVVAALDEREPPSPEIEALCDRIYQAIRDKRPPDEDSLVDAQPDQMAQQAGSQLSGDVQGDADRVAGGYDAMDSPPQGAPEQTPDPIATQNEAVGQRPADASQAAPAPVPAGNVSLDADVAGSQQQIEDAHMTGDVADEAARGDPDGPISTARGAQGELSEVAARDPAEVMRQQQEAVAHAQADMAQIQNGALAVLAASRRRTVQGTGAQQQQMVGTEEQMRQRVGEQARGIFTDAQTRVNALLEPLPRTAMAKWDAGKNLLSEDFKQSLARVKAWIEDRHSGIGGALTGAWDYVAGLPDWVTEEYDRAEKKFGDGVCDLIRDISRDVNTAVAACQAIIDGARRDIKALFDSLPAELQGWAQGEQAHLAEQLDGLSQRAETARTQVNHDLVDRASHAVQEVREQIHTLRQAAGGLLGKIRDAVQAFLDDPVKFIINGLLKLVGIEPGAFWSLVARIQSVMADIADDPMGFANNLLAAIGKGFSQFFDNFGTHLLKGFMSWLLGGLADVGVTIPADLSLKSIVTFILQLMGITWARIRVVLARHIGERNVALLEKAYQLVALLVEKGPEGIYEMVKEKLDPKTIIDQIIDMGIRFITEKVITQVAVRIMGMLNPAGAIAQALEAIYRVLKWVFQNAARIFALVETVVNGMAALIAGNIGGMANAVEKALAGLIAPVISFLADYLGFGDLPNKVKEAVVAMQAWVMEKIEAAVAWLVEKARGLLAALGISRPQQPGAGEGDGEIGETERFTAGGESHRLWIQVSGTQATVMVASDNPGPVQEKLADWAGRVGTLPDTNETGGNPRQEATSLIADARGLTGDADHSADELAAIIARNTTAPAAAPGGAAAGAENAEARAKDDALEAKERALATVLERLFVLFGGGGQTFAPIQKQAAMTGGQEPVEIVAEGNRLALKIGGAGPFLHFNDLAAGPLPSGLNQAGNRLATSVATDVQRVNTMVGAARLLNNRIEASLQTRLDAEATALATRIGEIGTQMRIPNLARGGRIEPIPPTLVEFEYTWSRNERYQGKLAEELAVQLARQQRGLNELSIDRWAVNVNVYQMDATMLRALDHSARDAVLTQLRERASTSEATATTKKTQYQAAIAEIDAARAAGRPVNRGLVEVVAGRYGNETEWRDLHSAGIEALYERLQRLDARWAIISRTLSRLAVLHNPDQVAGGPGEIPPIRIPPTSDDVEAWEQYMSDLEAVIGAARVNSSIGSNWGHKMPDIYTDITGRYPQPGWPIWRLNFNLQAVQSAG
ncbi:MAG TPA: DUF4157 domain-containing protein [Longimicrobiaceae bacterium]|jgi:hypothetical protein|nr:DUF4157 domain-containing protein [Longimicrobiaceae bacterium]